MDRGVVDGGRGDVVERGEPRPSPAVAEGEVARMGVAVAEYVVAERSRDDDREVARAADRPQQAGALGEAGAFVGRPDPVACGAAAAQRLTEALLVHAPCVQPFALAIEALDDQARPVADPLDPAVGHRQPDPPRDRHAEGLVGD